MVAIAYRNTVAAIVPEVTEGVPVAPTAATDYIAVQDDFELSSATDTLENAELRASIGRAKPILGAENPTASFSHYLRGSGVEGQAVNYRNVLKGFFGTETVNATERTTTVGSTVSQLVLGAGGADFPRGAGLLIKDGINGHRIRVSTGNSSNNVPLSFGLPTAPATGVSLGKAVFYSPANTAHQSMTVWHYVGNGGAIQMAAGCKVTEFGFNASAGELVNASYSMEGLEYFLDPIEITASKRYLDFQDDDGVAAAAIDIRWYKDPHEVAESLQAAMRAVSTELADVTYDDATGKFIIKSTGTLLSLLWNTGTNTANTIGTKLGFLVAADDTGTGATTGYTADNVQSYAAPQVPTYDNADPNAAKGHEVMIGTVTDYQCFEASSIDWTSSNGRRAIGSICATSGRSGAVITSREGQIQVVALLDQYDAKHYRRYRKGEEISFQYSFGPKTGGNWIAGKAGYCYAPICTVVEFSITDDDGLASLNMTLQPAVGSSGQGEMFVGTL